MHSKMIVLYEWRDLIENDGYLAALQALAILQVRNLENYKVARWNFMVIIFVLES